MTDKSSLTLADVLHELSSVGAFFGEIVQDHRDPRFERFQAAHEQAAVLRQHVDCPGGRRRNRNPADPSGLDSPAARNGGGVTMAKIRPWYPEYREFQRLEALNKARLGIPVRDDTLWTLIEFQIDEMKRALTGDDWPTFEASSQRLVRFRTMVLDGHKPMGGR
jgi:hypothetical protein